MSETTSSSVTDHLVYSFLNAPIRPYPFPHFHVENVFPADFYQEILSQTPEREDFRPIEETGHYVGDGGKTDRYIIPLRGKVDKVPEPQRDFWQSLTDVLQGQRFGEALLTKFHPFLTERFGPNLGEKMFGTDIMLIRDFADYNLDPHTDAPLRVIVIIFYLPETADHPELGTSIYVPKNPAMQCEGGPHYVLEDFNRVFTAPYVPNSALCFFKTTNSFHGVEPLPDPSLSRRLIHFFIRHH